MHLDLVKAKHVCLPHTYFVCAFYAQWRAYGMGIVVHEWGIRFLCITHHLCWHWRNYTKVAQ